MVKKMKSFIKIAIIVLIICSVTTPLDQSPVQAERSAEQISTITLTIEPSCNLGIIDADVSEKIAQNSGPEGKFIDGGVELTPGKPVLVVSANCRWSLSAKCNSFSGPYRKNPSDIMIKSSSSLETITGLADYQSLSAQDTGIAIGNQAVSKARIPCQYKILLDWDRDTPGTYNATVVYTLSTLGS